MSTDLAAFKEDQRRLWAAGDYAVAARRFEPAAVDLVAACGLRPGMRALDVGAGNGNVALAIANSGASPLACDLTPELVKAGQARCDRLGEWEIPWVVADAEELPFADGRFDAVLSVFGLVFAPRPEVAIAEAFRVTRSGGVVGLTASTPGSAATRFGEIAARYLPAPGSASTRATASTPRSDPGSDRTPSSAPIRGPGSDDRPPPPSLWGDEETARARLARHAVSVSFELGAVRWSWPSAAAAREEAEESNNVVAAARAALSQERYMSLLDELDDLMRSLNTSTDGGLTYDSEYARIVARKAG